MFVVARRGIREDVASYRVDLDVTETIAETESRRAKRYSIFDNESYNSCSGDVSRQLEERVQEMAGFKTRSGSR